MKHILNLFEKDIESFFKSLGEKPYRAAQVMRWIFKSGDSGFDKMTDLPPSLRDKLQRHFYVNSLTVRSTKEASDGTVRYNLETRDGHVFPCVQIKSKKRTTLCLSSQIGCPVSCAFCSSGANFTRNLTAGEILEQVLLVSKTLGGLPDGILFMGMGEPLINYDNVLRAIRVINSPSGFNIGSRHITLSTVGLVKGIKRLADDGVKIRLALSLHAPSDAMRRKLIPRASDRIDEVLAAALEYARISKTRFTIEYILIKNLNDTKNSMKELAALLKKHVLPDDKIQINLIPYNAVEGCNYETPSKEHQEKMKQFLISSGFFTIIRENKGREIKSACGQLGV